MRIFILLPQIYNLKASRNGRVGGGEPDGFAAGRADAAVEATDSGRQCPGAAHENDGKVLQKVHRQAGHFAGQLGTEMHSDVHGSIHGLV